MTPNPPSSLGRRPCLTGLAAAALVAVFSHAAETAPAPVTLEALSPETVAGFERVEFRIGGVGERPNPFDAAAIQVDLEIVGPGGTAIRVPAFFHQPFEFQTFPQGNRRSEWFYPAKLPEWRARFTPETPGAYHVAAAVTDVNGTRRSAARRLTCGPAVQKGFVRVSKADPRFFAFADETPFFPIGQNVAFVGTEQYLNTERAGEVFRKMAAQGANFARVWVCAEDWALGVEARKSAWGRSWTWQPPFVPLPDREGYHGEALCAQLGGAEPASVTLNPTQPIAVRAGTEYRLEGAVRTEAEARLNVDLEGLAPHPPVRSGKRGEWARFTRTFTAGSNQWWLGRMTLRTENAGRVWLRDFSLRESQGGPELLGEMQPRLAARGSYNAVDSYMLDRLVAAAEQAGIYLQLCLLTRDHYRHDLRDPASPAYQGAIDDACKLLRYAVARWGSSTHLLAWEYFNEMDPGAPTERFHQALGECLERTDPYRHLRTTSGWGPAPRQWNHPQLDMADLHHYMRPNALPAWQDDVAVVLDRAALLRGHAAQKPALLGEFGLADETWGLSPHMKQDTAGVHVHNALWASSFAGLSGTAMFWWWETLDQSDAYRHYRPLADFLQALPFTTAHLAPVVLASEPGACRVLAWRGSDQAYAWVFNPQATWWRAVKEQQPVAERAAENLTVPGLADGSYQVRWWDTWAGKVLREQTAPSVGGQLKLVAPTFTRDIACAITKRRD